jgi:hypothetical protein
MSSVKASAIARVAYEAERVYASALGEGPPPKWEDASRQEQVAVIAGVEAVLSGEARSGAHLHEAWAEQRAMLPTLQPIAPSYDELTLQQRRKLLLFRAVVLALVDGPCNGFCHDEKCGNLEDHDCHLDTCMSRFGIPPGLLRSERSSDRSGAGPAGPGEEPGVTLYC